MEIKDTLNWWVCDNIVHPTHKGQLGLLSLNEPQVFILLRHGDKLYASYEEFVDDVELNFLRPQDRATADIESILTDAYNFLILQDDEEERIANEYKDDED